MSARKKLYEITTIEGEVVEPSISIQEASKFLGRTVDSLYLAAMEGRKVAGKYRIGPVDVELSKEKDRKLLLEYDLTRLQIIKRARSGKAKQVEDDLYPASGKGTDMNKRIRKKKYKELWHENPPKWLKLLKCRITRYKPREIHTTLIFPLKFQKQRWRNSIKYFWELRENKHIRKTQIIL